MVGTIVITTCGLMTTNIKSEAEKQQLSNIAQYVATKSMEAISKPQIGYSTQIVSLSIPPLIGNQRYWIQIQNDSSNVWVEAGFGSTFATSEQRAYIPSKVSASGASISDSSTKSIKYQQNSTGTYLTIIGGN